MLYPTRSRVAMAESRSSSGCSSLAAKYRFDQFLRYALYARHKYPPNFDIEMDTYDLHMLGVNGVVFGGAAGDPQHGDHHITLLACTHCTYRVGQLSRMRSHCNSSSHRYQLYRNELLQKEASAKLPILNFTPSTVDTRASTPTRNDTEDTIGLKMGQVFRLWAAAKPVSHFACELCRVSMHHKAEFLLHLSGDSHERARKHLLQEAIAYYQAFCHPDTGCIYLFSITEGAVCGDIHRVVARDGVRPWSGYGHIEQISVIHPRSFRELDKPS